MQNILDALCYGNLCPSGRPLLPGSPAEKAHATFYEAALQLEKTLRGEEKELFERFTDAHQALSDCSCCEYFSDGFRLGARLMLEVMQPDLL
jgi:hypothetical protein